MATQQRTALSTGAAGGTGRAIACALVASGHRIRIRVNAELSGQPPEQIRKGYVDMTPLARPGSPADVARLVSFLAGDDSDFSTGQSIHVDGGFRMR